MIITCFIADVRCVTWLSHACNYPLAKRASMPRPPGVSFFHFYFTKTILFDGFGIKLNKLGIVSARSTVVFRGYAPSDVLSVDRVCETKRLCMPVLINSTQRYMVLVRWLVRVAIFKYFRDFTEMGILISAFDNMLRVETSVALRSVVPVAPIPWLWS